MTEKIKIDTIEEALEEIRNGKMVIVVDDEDRENEGDFICAAECITPEIVNFMSKEGRGLICAPLIESRCEELKLDLMVGTNTAAFETPFTVSVDLIGHGCTTGISAHDRFRTIKALADPVRRQLLDRLQARSGQTLSELCQGHDMTRQAVTKHQFQLWKPADHLDTSSSII